MAHVSDSSIIGVDGGGTTCRFALVHGGRRYDVQRRAANATTDPVGALAALQEGLSALAQAANIPMTELETFPAFLGLAGVVDDTIARDLAQALPLQTVRIEDDRRSAMVGALGTSDGCVIGIGTGSFFGRRVDARDRIIGGWGFILGDAASGADLGRHLLRCVLEVHDGLRDATALTDHMLAKFGSVAGVVAFATSAKPGDFAGFAPQIVAAAQEGDKVACHLMNQGAQNVSDALRDLGWQQGERICALGGLAPHYAPYLPADIAAHLAEPAGTALDGTLILAAQLTPMGETA
ncbi:BadF/BadG/BcrA/BcrD ATPase family protein [Jannaschia sp. CCS1]|uniref:BadF/BadG/BcrA/BcrD ATPase family protein n=1 Tax=Jannaschia sp. (strain CCS1) TaxID=290400 RepID=UPI0005C7893F|nr:BadF/BadG/BcrA/BcrD ATPase family protein [Jannaschia sp. CCS1]